MKKRLLTLSGFLLLSLFIIVVTGVPQADAAWNIALNFDGLIRDPAQPAPITETPDSSIAVGLNHVMQVVNLQLGMYDKNTGAAAATTTLDAFFGGVGGDCADANQLIGQPQVLYDWMSQRWLVTAVAFTDIDNGPYYECIAVSLSATPATLTAVDWQQYAIPIHPNYLHDLPKFGLWPDGIYMAANLYDVWDNGLHRTPEGAAVWVFNRDDLVAGNPTPATQDFYITESSGYKSLLPSNLLGDPPPAGTPNYFAAIQPPNQFLIWEFHVDWLNPGLSTFNGPKTVIVNAFTTRVGHLAEQQDNSENLDVVGNQLMPPLQYRYETDGTVAPVLWANHTVGHGGGSYTGIRWYEIRNPNTATPDVYQQGTFPETPDATYRWLGSMAVDGQGNMAIAYSASSATINPEIRQTGRLAGDGLGYLDPFEDTFSPVGTGPQDIHINDDGPWGKYSDMTVDPYDQCHFWYTNQYYDPTDAINWRTRITKFSLVDCAPENPGVVTRQSLHTDNTQALNGGSGIYDVAVSGNGRYVVFESEADNLVDDDFAGHVDVFLRDRDTDHNGVFDEPGFVSTTRVSVGWDGSEANGDSGVAVSGDFGGSGVAISANGNYIAFSSAASNLVPNDSNGTTDVFVYERSTGVAERVSLNSSGAEGNAVSDQPTISYDGRYVAFRSFANNLVTGDTNTVADIFLHDRITHVTTRVSVDSGGAEADGPSYSPAISPGSSAGNNGLYIAFTSNATNLVAADGNGFPDVFVHNRSTAATLRVSVNTAAGDANNRSYHPSVSTSGVIAFASEADDLVVGDTNGLADIFVRRWSAGPTTRVNVPPAGGEADDISYWPAISHNGTHVAFETEAGNLLPGDRNGLRDIYVAQLDASRHTMDMYRASFGYDPADTDANGSSFWPAISSDGQHTAFASNAINLVDDDTNNLRDVFAHDRDGVLPPGPLLSMPQGLPVVAANQVTVPISFTGNDHSIASTVFAIDLNNACLHFDPTDSDGDLIPDSVQFTLPANFQGTATYDAASLTLRIATYSIPPTALPDSDIVNVTFTAICQPEVGGSLFVPLRFANDPPTTFGNTNGDPVPGETHNGTLEILYNGAGDCNGDDAVDAADITALVLEIFDGDGTDPAATPGGTYPGNPYCDANADGVVDAADITRTICIIFNGVLTCQTGLPLLSASSAAPLPLSTTLMASGATLSLTERVMAVDGVATLPLHLEPNGHDLSSLAFSLDYNQTAVAFDPTDANGDGIPDAVMLQLPPGFNAAVTFDAADADGEIDIVIFDLSPPLLALPADVLLSVQLTVLPGVMGETAVRFSAWPAASAGDTTASTVPLVTTDGLIQIGYQLYLPLAVGQ